MNRFWSYLKFVFFANRSSFLLPLLVGPAFYIAAGLLELTASAPNITWGTASFTLGLIVGLQVTLKIFQPEMRRETASFYLGLPVSAVERFAAKWLLSCVLIFLGQFILITAIAAIFAMISGSQSSQWWLPLEESKKFLIGFFVSHSIFLAGGAFFQKSAFIKTMLSASVYLFVVACIIAAYSLSGNMEGGAGLGTTVFAASENLADKIAWCAALPLGLYAAAFQRSRELEARA